MNSQTDYSKFWSPAFDTMDDFIFLIDTDFTIREVNKSFLNFIKKSRSDLIGKKCYKFVHASTHPILACPHMRMLETKKFESSEYYEPSLKKWLYVRTTPIFDDSHNLLGSIHLAADVTARKAAEEEVARLAAIIESSEDAIVGKTLDGLITSWNKGAEKLYGYSAEEVLGRPVSLLVPPERSDELPGIYERIKRGEHVEHFETIRMKKDGTRINISLSVSPIKNSENTVIGASAITRDITKHKMADEELKKKMGELERFQKITVGRELKMKELKTRIVELENKIKVQP